jgi:hypothetical protein
MIFLGHYTDSGGFNFEMITLELGICHGETQVKNSNIVQGLIHLLA